LCLALFNYKSMQNVVLQGFMFVNCEGQKAKMCYDYGRNAVMSTNCCILLDTFKSDLIEQCVTIMVVFKSLCLTPKGMQRKMNYFLCKSCCILFDTIKSYFKTLIIIISVVQFYIQVH